MTINILPFSQGWCGAQGRQWLEECLTNYKYEHLANFQREFRFLRIFDMPRSVLRPDIWELEDLVPALTPILLTRRKRFASHGPASGTLPQGRQRSQGVSGQLDFSEVGVLTEIRLGSSGLGGIWVGSGSVGKGLVWGASRRAAGWSRVQIERGGISTGCLRYLGQLEEPSESTEKLDSLGLNAAGSREPRKAPG